ncbi:membrane-bound PQQ-dependent dehydrogenase, glucose/quinate/shikimate family [Paracoccus tegillarcae]|uniref:Membrane-bound PQQ-dependent dehydrogenase, glucose/quinate/shikimate family n=1 Tax=Paracoccus tegillarcae TaxID=1529068 RepID=A0A2K9ELV5_9RHOB|nr:membrane-bound PQQ-dependent dehydrogenase, glucose/quinate/shikimate family [Paracoccus tegillarcae]
MRVFGFVLGVVGLILTFGGIYLITLGGSWYYAITGLLMSLAAFRTFRGQANGLYLYLFVFLGTVLWAIWEVGFSFWPLVPRLVAPVFLAACALLLLPLVREGAGRPASARPFVAGGIGLSAIFAGFMALMFMPHDVVQNDVSITPGQVSAATENVGENWVAWGKTSEGLRYSTAEQITPENVSQLEVAWVAQTGFIADQSQNLQDQNTPLYVDGTLYQCASGSQVTALDGITGEIKWQFDPQGASPYWKRCRTLAYFDPGPQDTCGPRIVMTTTDTRLISLRASDGSTCETFGTNGMLDLAAGMGQLVPGDPIDENTVIPPLPGFLAQTTGPFIGGDKIILGAWVADNVSMGEPSGAVRAFDARTGAQVWAWDLGNPEITNLPPEGETYTRGTPNVWSGISIDEELGLVYLPLGNATPDYYGGHRRDFDDEYNASLVALRLDDGREAWHFRTQNHDLWDYDLPSQPALANVPDGNGGAIPAVIQTTKRGQIFVLDRRNGQPIKTVEEKPVPAGDGVIDGEYYAETQPYSTGMAAIGGDPLSEKQMWGATPIDQMMCRIMFKSYKYEGDFTPQSTQKTLVYPGNNGGMNWGSASVDQGRNIMVVADMRMPVVTQLLPREQFRKDNPDFEGDPHGALSAQFGLPYAHSVVNFMSPLGVPCLQPPWGTVSAVDVASGELVWQQPAGTGKDATLVGIGLQNPLPFYVGMPALGGAITTGSGLTFHSGTQDYYLRAYDTETGDVLWKGRLPSGSQSTPMTYIGPDGRQYIVLTAGGARYNPNDWADYIIAFALPE